MQLLIFFILGMIDVYAIFGLIFKTFKFPYFEYFKEFTILAVITSIVSYIIRIYFSANPLFDILAHYILYVMFLWLVVRAKLWISLVTSVMYFAYGAISFIVYFFYISTKILSADLLNSSDSYEVFIIQITQQAVAIIFSYFMYRFDFGISKFARPPHDFVAKTNLSKKEIKVLYVIMVVAFISFLAGFFIYRTKSLLMVPLYLCGFLIMIYLGYKRGKYDWSYRVDRFEIC